MSSSVAIHVDRLSKRYELGARQASYRTLREAVTATALAPLHALRRLGKRKELEERTMWALRDVSFDVQVGSVLGIIGRNGAGKSTLLKILSRITEPTGGRAEIRGRVGSLLEVGTGFHPELSGRENILLNGAILGMSRADIVRKFDQIVAFAEVEKFIDTAVKHYSSGMYLRLAFAVAAHLEPEILLVDEVLAVGDQSFQAKCLGKMGEVAGEGRTVLFVSHNMAAVRGLCTEAMLLRGGEVAVRGKPADVINQYLMRDEDVSGDLASVREREGDGSIRFTSVKVIDHNGQASDTVYCGESMTIELTYEAKPGVEGSALVFHLYFCNSYGERLFTCSTRYTPSTPATFPTSGKIRCIVDRVALAPDSYTFDIAVKLRETLADMVWRAKTVTVGEADFYGSGATPRAAAGPLLVDHRFEIVT